jgi:hypothetical protein
METGIEVDKIRRDIGGRSERGERSVREYKEMEESKRKNKV